MIIVFIDLDDTIFQTKRKNINGIYNATIVGESSKTSFMTEEQNILLNLFFENKNIKLIPLTARNKEQYDRTMFKDKLLDYSVCFSGKIYINNEQSKEWDNIVYKNFSKSILKLEDIYSKLEEYAKDNFRILIVENSYISIKHNDINSINFYKDKKNILEIISKNINEEYFLYENDNNITILPKFLDKEYACKYFIDYYKPSLTIGIGDSVSDYGFMDICNYKMIPSNTQLDKFIKKFIYA